VAFIHGSKAKFGLGTAGTPTVIVDRSPFIMNIQFPQTSDTAETSTLGNLFKTYVPGLTDSTVSIDGRYDPTLDAVLFALMGTASVNFQYDPQGSTTGLIRFTGSAVPTSYQVTAGIGDVSSWTFAMQCTSAIVRATI
jgi:hypothetical protein